MKRFSLKLKLIASFLLVAGFVCGVAGVNLYYNRQTAKETEDVTLTVLPHVEAVMDMRVALMRVSRIMPGLGMNLSEGRFDPKLEESYRKSLNEYEKAEATYRSIPFLTGEEELLKASVAAWAEVLPITKRLMEIAGSAKKEDYEAFNKLYREGFVPGYEKVVKAQKAICEKQRELAKANIAEVHNVTRFSDTLATILALVGTLCAAGLGVFVSAVLTRELAGAVGQVRASSEELNSAADAIAISSADIAQGNASQASAIQETAAAVEEVTAMIKRNSENATRSKDSSAESLRFAEDGERQLNSMIEAIQAVVQANERVLRQVEDGNRDIGGIVALIQGIGAKTRVINDIVFQTKLLSFNASVEAARAGEHGKGFSVVAEEVGNLARMSGTAAQEISELLDTSVSQVEAIVGRTKEGVGQLTGEAKAKVDSTAGVAQRCGEALRLIRGSVESVDRLLSEISHASREQATGMSEISKAISQLEAVTAKNAAVSQRCAAASEQLHGQAQDMGGLVQSLNQFMNGSSAPGAATAGAEVVSMNRHLADELSSKARKSA